MQAYGSRLAYPMQVIELSKHGFQAECATPLPEGTQGEVEIELGEHETTTVQATAVRRVETDGNVYYGFLVPAPDDAWQRYVNALNVGRTQAELASSVPNLAPALAPRQRLVLVPA